LLRDIALHRSYRSSESSLVHDFYVPCLSNSVEYWRAVGFFSSSALSVAAKGLGAFIRSGGSMRLVASPLLSRADAESIQHGYAAREAAETSAVLRALDEPLDQVSLGRLGFLAWLIEHSRLDIRLAVLRESIGQGIYHEKLGIFFDGRDSVAFIGSPNESASGLVANFESIDVYCSWRAEDAERAGDKVKYFGELWADRLGPLRVIPFPQAARERLLRYRTDDALSDDPELSQPPSRPIGTPRLPDWLNLRPYQRNAVDNWFAAQGRGTLKMATGSGKTFVALAVVERLYRTIGLQCAIILAPYQHLVLQWISECRKFGLEPVPCHRGRDKWSTALHGSLAQTRLSGGFATVIATNATFRTATFQRLLPHFPEKTIIIGDEVHNLGAVDLSSALPRSVGMRLGLSATPERWFDESGTKELLDYFGAVVQPEFTLRDALAAGALVPYTYHPVLVKLDEEEAQEYVELTKRIGKAFHSLDPSAPSSYLEALLFQRARILGSARNKLVALKQIMTGRLDSTHTLFYCGDGTVESTVSGEEVRHVEAVCQLLGAGLGYRVDTYTADTPLDMREDLRDRFIRGELQGLVAIRCLDEGVDVPMIRTAFIMASSTNPRQFIQRRGRVLRPFPGKTRAEIYDFIVEPPPLDAASFEVERNLMRRELRRYVEFADLAENAGAARALLVDLQRRYHLLEL
jgi:DNA phosphorothioation system restriction enzyme